MSSIFENREGQLTEYMSSGEVSRHTGVSLRQLQWWDERDVVCPRIMGHRRFYTHDDVAVVQLVAALRKKNVSLQRSRRAVAFLRKDVAQLSRIWNGHAYLLIDTGLRRFHVECEPERVCELMTESSRAMVVVRVPGATAAARA